MRSASSTSRRRAQMGARNRAGRRGGASAGWGLDAVTRRAVTRESMVVSAAVTGVVTAADAI